MIEWKGQLLLLRKKKNNNKWLRIRYFDNWKIKHWRIKFTIKQNTSKHHDRTINREIFHFKKLIPYGRSLDRIIQCRTFLGIRYYFACPTSYNISQYFAHPLGRVTCCPVSANVSEFLARNLTAVKNNHNYYTFFGLIPLKSGSGPNPTVSVILDNFNASYYKLFFLLNEKSRPSSV